MILPKSIALSFLKHPGDRILTPVLFLHGLFGNKNNWKSIARQVTEATKRSTYCLDLRNHGDSGHTEPKEASVLASASDIKTFLENQELKSCILTGHSFGGRVAMQFCSLFPESVERAVILDVSPVSLPSSMSTLVSYIQCMERIIHSIPASLPLAQIRKQADTILSDTIEVVILFFDQFNRKLV